MKSAEDWLELACAGSFVSECVPLGFQPTLPELYRNQGKNCLRFHYYRVRMDNGEIRISKPMYQVSFSETGSPVSFTQIEDEVGDYTAANEMLQTAFAERQKKYLAELDRVLALMETDSSDAKRYGLYSLWLDAQPECLRGTLKIQTEEDHKVFDCEKGGMRL